MKTNRSICLHWIRLFLKATDRIEEFTDVNNKKKKLRPTLT